jgi:hypothetical protein
MFYETQIGKLSKVQLNNLLKGKNVRIKKGTSHTINLTEAQVKKFHRNSRQGKALTIKLNQDQIAKQGSGILGDVVGMIHPTAGILAKAVGLGMKKKRGSGILGDVVGMIHPTAGILAKAVGLGMKKKRGKGLMGDLANSAMFSAGVHNKLLAPKKYGKGFLENLAKEAAINLAKTAGKFAVDKSLELGGNFVKGKIEGLGMRRKRSATPAQLAALAKGRAIRDANRYGGALYVA